MCDIDPLDDINYYYDSDSFDSYEYTCCRCHKYYHCSRMGCKRCLQKCNYCFCKICILCIEDDSLHCIHCNKIVCKFHNWGDHETICDPCYDKYNDWLWIVDDLLENVFPDLIGDIIYKLLEV